MADTKPSTSLFDVYLRLRPAASIVSAERFLDVEAPEEEFPKHITIKPPTNDHRKRAIERFAFTRVFEENAGQSTIFNGVGVHPLIDGVLGQEGREGRDGLLATLGVTGSGKSHTILGTKTQRGLTQMTLDTLYQSIGSNLVHPTCVQSVHQSIAASDVSEAQVFLASQFLDSLYGDGQSEAGYRSRAQTPMVCSASSTISSAAHPTSRGLYPSLRRYNPDSPSCNPPQYSSTPAISHILRQLPSFARLTRNAAKTRISRVQDNTSFISTPGPKRSIPIPRPSALPQYPIVDADGLRADSTAEYAIVISMYEVYNDRIFDLLTGSALGSKLRPQKPRALLFKPTEHSPDRKVVAGLRKVVCSTLEEAIMVLETGLMERKVAGTGSNAVSSRSHGFFCMEVKKRRRVHGGTWSTSTLTITDLAGSERARNAKTAGATLAEAGKINESLMYLGQCMQMQSDQQDGTRNIVPFRQCKLTELLFSNSFPSQHAQHHQQRRPQKAIMIVTADPVGDFNATSQILRYSALAREVTVPRIPSVTSQILSGEIVHDRPGSANGRTAIPTAASEDLELASKEIARLSEEVDVLALQLAEEATRRQTAETCWAATEERMEALEQEIRDECYDEMEQRLETERRRWKAAWDDEADRNDEHLDRKIEILTTATEEIQIYEDPEPTQHEHMQELQAESEALQRRIEQLERELLGRSPTKKQRVLKTKKWEVDVGTESP